MAAYQQGDVSAFAELVARHEQPLWGFLLRLVKNRATAEDLLQETFMRVVKSAPEWRPNAKFSTWLYTIARNLCVDHARAARHRSALSLDAADERDSSPGLHERLPGDERGAEQRALGRELTGELDRALAALPEAQREVFVMRELLELPFAEIALAVGTSEATVKSRMRYALERLRDALSAWREEPAEEVAP
jgi:RNA polymerase sigma-70 factor, ECF subfamily